MHTNPDDVYLNHWTRAFDAPFRLGVAADRRVGGGPPPVRRPELFGLGEAAALDRPRRDGDGAGLGFNSINI